MPILDFSEVDVNRKRFRSLLSEILMSGNVPIDDETSHPIRRVKCRQCGWKHELGEDVAKELGIRPARQHRDVTGHTDIRHRFDMLDVDEGAVDLRTRIDEVRS